VIVPKERAGSYTFNFWLLGPPLIVDYDSDWSWRADLRSKLFVDDGGISQPALTPVVADGITYLTLPFPGDYPSPNLFYGVNRTDNGGDSSEMQTMCIPRHGKRPSQAPTYWPVTKPLPGAINVSFFDGHAELVPLERLWQLQWYRQWQAPAKRPGLPLFFGCIGTRQVSFERFPAQDRLGSPVNSQF